MMAVRDLGCERSRLLDYLKQSPPHAQDKFLILFSTGKKTPKTFPWFNLFPEWHTGIQSPWHHCLPPPPCNTVTCENTTIPCISHAFILASPDTISRSLAWIQSWSSSNVYCQSEKKKKKEIQRITNQWNHNCLL